jgi:hypothetical protein
VGSITTGEAGDVDQEGSHFSFWQANAI